MSKQLVIYALNKALSDAKNCYVDIKVHYLDSNMDIFLVHPQLGESKVCTVKPKYAPAWVEKAQKVINKRIEDIEAAIAELEGGVL